MALAVQGMGCWALKAWKGFLGAVPRDVRTAGRPPERSHRVTMLFGKKRRTADHPPAPSATSERGIEKGCAPRAPVGLLNTSSRWPINSARRIHRPGRFAVAGSNPPRRSQVR